MLGCVHQDMAVSNEGCKYFADSKVIIIEINKFQSLDYLVR